MIKQFNAAMAYIEANLTRELDSEQIARIAGCSEYHFRRMFSFMAGMPLGEYIRRRKLALAAEVLSSTNKKVSDVAYDFGYETPESFSKAFQKVHGVNPSQMKRADASFKNLLPLTFQLTIKGGTTMDYRIVQKEPFKIVGFKKRITLQYNGVNHQIEALTARLTPKIIAELKSFCDLEPRGMLNVSANFAGDRSEGSELDQYLGVATTQAVTADYDILAVPAATWVVFNVVGKFPEALQATWAQIYSEWFPTTDYQLTGGPEMLWNEVPDTTKPDYHSQIWIPVQKK
ncbi:AraC family transcriptional regulator [Lapidilactobacillus luobeiensis]|uniref:AraC family transcriptional regulator n=1 Tax=Lapidilactobacillus luobeiensis TaxID=2950371 RepID=UPI0021C3A1A4|nr:AraC family transcriptional regulator [Lapidilactobacillus luobeiensis]